MGHHDRAGLKPTKHMQSWNFSRGTRGCSQDQLNAGLIYCFVGGITVELSSADPLRKPPRDKSMSDWLHNLPVVWMALVVFGATYLVAAVIYIAVMVLAVGERARSFKAISAGMLFTSFWLRMTRPMIRPLMLAQTTKLF